MVGRNAERKLPGTTNTNSRASSITLVDLSVLNCMSKTEIPEKFFMERSDQPCLLIQFTQLGNRVVP